MAARPDLAFTLPLTGVDAGTGIEIARAAADHGFTACWTAEVQGPDAFTTLGALAVATDLDLGVAVVPAQTRTAPTLGMSAVSLAELSGGRFTLGIGASSEVIVSRWSGQPFDKPLTAVRETVEALRPMLRGERSTVDGQVIQVGGYKPHAVPPGGRVPLVLGALNPRSCRMVGELAVDGVCLNQLAPHHVPLVLDEVATGFGGTIPGDFAVIARLFVGVTDDVPAMRQVVKAVFGPYIATSVYNKFYRWMGYEEVAQAVLDAGGDKQAMAAAVTDEVVDDLFCLGTADEVAAKVAAYAEVGVTVPVLAPLSLGREQAESTLWAVADAYRAL
ncbi:LLM class F420-dependent oxidoreductase [Nitriliruptor alkaliphilus]|uniref:LLM class F420-dependent oxidoreductase n=1 Tax=Nitriliruptor alkaliphilus TaxID=427918 RepID=UPI000696B4DC|nr:LLM class F420-dependent oxidoreductase [Nitriliruptor alkaliphilus]